MAATRGRIVTERDGEVSRLGHKYVTAHADTWRTFATATVWADGRCTVTVERDGKSVHEYDLGPEGGEK